MDSDTTGSASSPGPGGFVVADQPGTGLASPAYSLLAHGGSGGGSSASSTRARAPAGLPHPRRRALRAGSAKENMVRRFASGRILAINRRFIKKYAISDPSDTVVGYASMGELCRDVDHLLDALWKSGTPHLQIQYLLNIGSEFITWMDGFAPSPRATLAILRKLDYCFASLLGGADLATGEPLPGFEKEEGNGLRRVGMTQTDMVRCRSLAEQSRITVVDVFQRGPPDPLDEEGHGHHGHGHGHHHHQNCASTPRPPPTPASMRESTADDDTETETDAMVETDTENGTLTRETTAEPGDEDMDVDNDDNDDNNDSDSDSDSDSDLDEDEQMLVATVYEHTLVKLGERLGDGYGRIGDFAPLPQPSASGTCTTVEVDFGENDDDEY